MSGRHMVGVTGEVWRNWKPPHDAYAPMIVEWSGDRYLSVTNGCAIVFIRMAPDARVVGGHLFSVAPLTMLMKMRSILAAELADSADASFEDLLKFAGQLELPWYTQGDSKEEGTGEWQTRPAKFCRGAICIDRNLLALTLTTVSPAPCRIGRAQFGEHGHPMLIVEAQNGSWRAGIMGLNLEESYWLEPEHVARIVEWPGDLVQRAEGGLI